MVQVARARGPQGEHQVGQAVRVGQMAEGDADSGSGFHRADAGDERIDAGGEMGAVFKRRRHHEQHLPAFHLHTWRPGLSMSTSPVWVQSSDAGPPLSMSGGVLVQTFSKIAAANNSHISSSAPAPMAKAGKRRRMSLEVQWT